MSPLRRNGLEKKTNRSVGVQVATHVLNLELQLLLRSLCGTLETTVSRLCPYDAISGHPTLKARCSRKWAVPFVSLVSAREPASIQTPTVDVWAHGEYSVATWCLSVSKTGVRGTRLGQLAPGVGAHSQAVLEGCCLSLADVGGSSKASSQSTGGCQAGTGSQALRQVQS